MLLGTLIEDIKPTIATSAILSHSCKFYLVNSPHSDVNLDLFAVEPSGMQDGECQLAVKSTQTQRPGEPSVEISSTEPTDQRTNVGVLPEPPTSNGSGQIN